MGTGGKPKYFVKAAAMLGTELCLISKVIVDAGGNKYTKKSNGGKQVRPICWQTSKLENKLNA